MKVKSLKLLLLLPLIVFLLPGCGIPNDTIKDALNNEENCLKACDEMEAAAIVEYNRCIRECGSIPEACLRMPPTPQCIEIALKIDSCKSNCFIEFQAKLEEIRRCRNDCRNKFPLEIKLK